MHAVSEVRCVRCIIREVVTRFSERTHSTVCVVCILVVSEIEAGSLSLAAHSLVR
jgi:hypothetical protein